MTRSPLFENAAQRRTKDRAGKFYNAISGLDSNDKHQLMPAAVSYTVHGNAIMASVCVTVR